MKGFRSTEVVLARVVESEMPSYRGTAEIDPEILAEREAEKISFAKDYLNQVAARIKQEGTTIQTEVLMGVVTESLIDYVGKRDIELIFIATHGRSGVTRWVRGSVADKILRSANVPVLMVRAPGTKGEI